MSIPSVTYLDHIKENTYFNTNMVERIIVGPLFTNSYLYFIGKKQCLVIDPGADSQSIIRQITILNKTPLYIVFTHGHIDHTAAAIELQLHFNSSEILNLAHKEELPFFGNEAESRHRNSFQRLGVEGEALFLELFHGVPTIDVVLQEGDLIPETDLRVLHTPGHSPGSICLYSETKKILFSGDTLFFEGVGRTDLEGGDPESLERSIREKLYTLPPETRVFPGHGPQTTIERELRYNPFFRG